MRSVVFIPEGIGDALLMVPMLKTLQGQGVSVTAIFTSSFPIESLFWGSRLLNNTISWQNKSLKKIKLLLAFKDKFDVAYLNAFASTTVNLLVALKLARNVVTNRIPKNFFRLISRIQVITPRPYIHDAIQNLLLLEAWQQKKDNSNILPPLCEEDFLLDSLLLLAQQQDRMNTFLLSHRPYIALQPSAEDPLIPYKSCADGFWEEMVQYIQKRFPQLGILLIGGEPEARVAERICNLSTRATSLAGKTTLREVAQVIAHSILFLGIDSGLMHIAAALGKPTFIVWGGSDYRLYGYPSVNPRKHKIVVSPPLCWPCNSWIFPNRYRVTNPLHCPDYACIRNISAAEVFEELESYLLTLSDLPSSLMSH